MFITRPAHIDRPPRTPTGAKSRDGAPYSTPPQLRRGPDLAPRSAAENVGMIVRVRHRVWVWVAAGFVALVSIVAVVGATARPEPRAALLLGLQRPAVATSAIAPTPPRQVRAQHGHAGLTLAGRAYAMSISPNVATAHNRLSLAVTAGGQAVAGATVTVAFSMPAMDMWRAFSVTLTHTAGGPYVTTMPFVGMPGEWRLDVRVALPGHRPAAFAVTDALGS
jgi:hypothetical protein